MTFRERFSNHTSNLLWTCVVCVIVAIILLAFGSAFLACAGWLLLAVAVIAPIACLLAPVFFLYVFVRTVIDWVRGRR